MPVRLIQIPRPYVTLPWRQPLADGQLHPWRGGSNGPGRRLQLGGLQRVAAILLLLGQAVTLRADAELAVDFHRQIRPILSDVCFQCHGPDASQRQADLRLDTSEGVSEHLVVAGQPSQSELFLRMTAESADERMPPPGAKRQLTNQQIELVRRWIQQGGSWGRHWSFEAPYRAAIPPVSDAPWTHTPVDRFVLARLDRQGLRPSPEADSATLLRRVTLDLTGLPPSLEEVDGFLADRSPDAFQRVVDRLLASVHYGEQMALIWLDAARYADSAGYQNDFKRSQWPWRDWVVRSYNANLPFDQFTIQQLAGDQLDDPTEDQLLATAFNRNHRINNEGGIIPEEFLVEYVADRVETTATVWLGLTVGCARCHDHKYDPISQKDFYRMFAFFHNVPERGKDGDIAPRPNIAVYAGPSQRQLHASLRQKLAQLRQGKTAYIASGKSVMSTWIGQQAKSARSQQGYTSLPRPRAHYAFDFVSAPRVENLAAPAGHAVASGKRKSILFRKPARHGNAVFIRTGGYLKLGPLFGSGGYSAVEPMTWSCWIQPGNDIGNVEGPVFSSVTPDERLRGYQILLIETSGSKMFRVAFRLNSDQQAGEAIEVVSSPAIARNQFTHLAVTYDGSLSGSGVSIYINAEPVETTVAKDQLSAGFNTHEDVLVGAQTESTAGTNFRDHELRNTYLDDLLIYRTALSEPQIRCLVALTPSQLIAGQSRPAETGRSYLEQVYFQQHDPQYQQLLKQLASAKSELEQFESEQVTYVSVMQEMKSPRDTFLLTRGAYDQPDTSERLQPNTLSALPAMEPALPRNRLGLAQSLFSPSQPLTSRVAVNRYWQKYFGRGLVKTPEDFGSQGAPPTHPRLLDWLAVRFRELDWDIKAMQRLIVSSATYRQQSHLTKTLIQRDPENQFYARGPRLRLSGQALRDQALAVSGLLVRSLGGPPVMPYQPEGLWEEVSAKGFKYQVARGESLYRRSLYTFWRRTVPPPSMMNFDNASREFCSVGRSQTNTPLQALNLLNDPTFVEAARAMAQRVMREPDQSEVQRISLGYRLLLGRAPSPQVLRILQRGYRDYLSAFEQQPEAARRLTETGWSKPDPQLDPCQLAAHTLVANTIFNLDETVTKE